MRRPGKPSTLNYNLRTTYDGWLDAIAASYGDLGNARVLDIAVGAPVSPWAALVENRAAQLVRNKVRVKKDEGGISEVYPPSPCQASAGMNGEDLMVRCGMTGVMLDCAAFQSAKNSCVTRYWK